MKKEVRQEFIERIYDDIFPDCLQPRCPYCGMPIELSQQFCCEAHETAFYNEMDNWMNREEEEYLKREKEDK